jgi:glycine/D-amino acid oxidase-like deaminating enzyme/nitrite reductase/ring-hydroxylating ferredoxin subunit
MPQPATIATAHTPYWAESAAFPAFAAIDRDAHVDVLVVGGGITGLTAAYLLTSAGKTVALLDRGRCAQADTGHTTAHVTMVTDTRLTELASRFGRPHAQAVWDAGLAALSQIAAIVRDHPIDCDFGWVDGYLHAPIGDARSSRVSSFADDAALARDLGFDATMVDDVPLVGGAGVRFAHQARLHPRKYLAGLARAITTRGGHIYEHSDAGTFCRDPRGVAVGGHRVTCEDIVLATHNPLVGIGNPASAALLQTKLALYSTYVVAGRVRPGQVLDALFWDSGLPYHYLRVEPQGDHDLVIFGGEDHKTGQVADTAACYDRLARALTALVPEVAFSHRWSGQVIEALDGLPYIGPSADHQYVAAGFGGNGMTFGTLGAMMIADRILGQKNPWSELFAPERTAILHGTWDYVKENADYPYYLMRDRLAAAERPNLSALARGQGQVIDRDGAKVAAFRDESGAMVLRSAICTHMGCVVGWNDAEGTWDCPCHGSRFTPTGEVLAGPAQAPLPLIE